MNMARGLVSALGAATAGGLAYAAIHGSSQITHPARTLPELSPRDLGYTFESVALESTDGVPLSAWLVPCSTTSAAVIVLHGFGGNKGTMLNIIDLLAPRFNVLALDVRGHGESGGAWTSVGHYERLDAIAAAVELSRRGFGPIGMLGISMGASVSLLAAAESELIRSVVADSGFAVLRHAVTGHARLRGYPPGLAQIASRVACAASALTLHHPVVGCDPVLAIPRIAPRPTFLIHCEQDELIPVSDVHALYAASGDPCELWVIPDLAHADSSSGAKEEYGQRVLRFLSDSLR